MHTHPTHTQGNDGGPKQALWENALDVKPLMTAEDHALIGWSSLSA